VAATAGRDGSGIRFAKGSAPKADCLPAGQEGELPVLRGAVLISRREAVPGGETGGRPARADSGAEGTVPGLATAVRKRISTVSRAGEAASVRAGSAPELARARVPGSHSAGWLDTLLRPAASQLPPAPAAADRAPLAALAPHGGILPLARSSRRPAGLVRAVADTGRGTPAGGAPPERGGEARQDEVPATAANAAQSSTPGMMSAVPLPAPGAPGSREIDLERLADRVYAIIERRLIIEKESRGL
jgi:hypothetical protein